MTKINMQQINKQKVKYILTFFFFFLVGEGGEGFSAMLQAAFMLGYNQDIC